MDVATIQPFQFIDETLADYDIEWTFFDTKGTTSYTYDANANLTLVDYPSGTTDVTYKYDALNRLTNMVDAAGTTTNSYRLGGAMAIEDGPWASDTVTYQYHTSVPGLRTSLGLQQPTGTWSQTSSYDAGKRLQSIVAPQGTFTYAYQGAGTVWTNLALPNTSAVTNGYDTMARLLNTTLKTSGGTVLDRSTYGYNVASQRTSQGRTDASTVTYTYDNIGELQSAIGSGGLSTENLGYKYDAAFNLNKRTNSSTVTTLTVDSKNQLSKDGSYARIHDDNGNLTDVFSAYWTYSYDAENRLVTAQNAVYWKTDFVYDGKSRLRKRIEYAWSGSSWTTSSETRYVYDGMLVVQERNSSNTPTVGYTRGKDLSGSIQGAGGIGGLLARSQGYSSGTGAWSTHHYYHADGNGNITYLVDASQALTASYKYDPYGKTLSSSGSLASANVYRFSSKEFHANSGFYCYSYRFYDPANQRWLNRDPLGEPGFEVIRSSSSMGAGVNPAGDRVVRLLGRVRVDFPFRGAEVEAGNLYAFVRNTPVSVTDPLGLRHWYYGWQAGKLCTSKDCDKDKCPVSAVKYLDEDEWKTGFHDAPAPGKCVDVDAVATPNGYWKIPDNCTVTIECDNKDGSIQLKWKCYGAGFPKPTPAPVPPFPPSPYPQK